MNPLNRNQLQRQRVKWMVVAAFTLIAEFPVFVTWNNWINAKSREDAQKFLNTSIREDWETVLTGHRQVVEWPLGTIGDNPWGFALCTLLMLAIGAPCLTACIKATRIENMLKVEDDLRRSG